MNGTLSCSLSHIVMPVFTVVGGSSQVAFGCFLLSYCTHIYISLSLWYYGEKNMIRCSSSCKVIGCVSLAFDVNLASCKSQARRKVISIDFER